jgi:hypothetical protein
MFKEGIQFEQKKEEWFQCFLLQIGVSVIQQTVVWRTGMAEQV